MTNAATLAALDAVQDAAAALATAVQDAKDALAGEPPTIKVGDRVEVVADYYSGRTEHLGKIGTVEDVNRRGFNDKTIPFVVCLDGIRGSYYMREVKPVTEAPTPDPTPTRVEIRTTDDRERVVAAEPGIHGEGSVYLAVSAYGDRCAAWLSRDEARRLAATLTAIADTP